MFQRLAIVMLIASTVFGQTDTAIKCGFHEQKQTLKVASVSSDREFDYLDEYILSPEGHFKIHFTRSGVHAVTGAAGSGTPTFIEEAGIAADSAYHLIVNDLGFLPPLSDSDTDGPELDIYVVDMKSNYGGSVYYGMTTFPKTFTTPYSGLPTYLEIDNNYTEPQYATSGLAALRATIAHEFFHMVQLRYAHPFSPYSSNAYWYEISSTWMEEKCYPEIDDYHAYVADNFYQTTFPNLEDPSAGFRYSYGHGLFGQVLDMEYGFSGSKHIMLDIWESLDDREATENLEMVLKSSRWNSSLTDALGKYALYNVFTGSRAIAGQYYEDAALLPEIRTINYTLPTSFPIPYEFSLDPLQMSYKRFNAQSMSKIYVKGNNLTPKQRVYLTVTDYDEGSSLKSAISDPWIECDSVSSQDYVIFPMVNGDPDQASIFSITFQGDALDLETIIQSLWPNPSLLHGDPVYLNIMLGEPATLELNVFNILGVNVHTQSEFHPEGIRILRLQLPSSLPSGMYIVQVIAGDEVLSKKFTVLK